jgi:hypothetical protein
MKSEFLKIANVKTQKEFYAKYPNEASFFAAHPEAKHLKAMAKGGSASNQQQQIMQIIQAYAKASGTNPKQIMQQLQQMQPQQQQQALQQMMQSLQGQSQQSQGQQMSPQQQQMMSQQQGQPQMQMGGGLNYYDTEYAYGGNYVAHPSQFGEGGGYYMGNDEKKHKSTGANWSGNAFYADGGSAPLEYPHMFKYAPTYEVGPHMAYGGYYQDGGMQQDPSQGQPQQGQGVDPQQIMQEIAQKLQQGEDPNQIVQELVQEGVPQDQAQQMVQQVAQQMQQQGGGQDQGQQQAPPDQEQGQPGMKYGGIHIKKSHEGMFTAYKKRTGKTTEEALHSPDPHVRQMANFARNAAKWKHETGGQYGGQYMQQGGISIGQTMDVTPEQAAYLKQMGYTFEKI